MTRKVLIFLLTMSVALATPYFFAGVDITGHIFPYIGLGMNTGNGFLNFLLGVTNSEGVWAFETKTEYVFYFHSVGIGGTFDVITALDGTQEGDLTIGPDNFLLLIGPRLSYSLSLGLVDLEAAAETFFTLPIGSTETVKGPIPFFSLRISQNKGF